MKTKTEKNNQTPSITEEERRLLDAIVDAVNDTINRVMESFEMFGNDYGKAIPQKLMDLKVFDNQAFICFLLHLFGSCEYMYSLTKEGKAVIGAPFTEEQQRACFGTARLMMTMIVPCDDPVRKEAEGFFEIPEVMLFINAFIDTAPFVRLVQQMAKA